MKVQWSVILATSRTAPKRLTKPSLPPGGDCEQALAYRCALSNFSSQQPAPDKLDASLLLPEDFIQLPVSLVGGASAA